MRLLMLLSALVISSSHSTAAPAPAGPPGLTKSAGKTCTTAPRWARDRGGRRLLDPSGEVVTYDLHLAYIREIDGCWVPTVLRRDVDGRGQDFDDIRLRRGPTDAPTILRPL